MPIKKLKLFLDKNHVSYEVIKHSSAFTAQETAALAHIAGKEFAKTVMIKVHGKMAMAVLPASYQVDFNAFEQIFGKNNVRLATEMEFKSMFPECEVGAMPPFGNLYDMEVYVAETLAEDKEITFNAGTHTELIRMDYDDFKKLVQPEIFRFSWKMASMPGDPHERWEEDH